MNQKNTYEVNHNSKKKKNIGKWDNKGKMHKTVYFNFMREITIIPCSTEKKNQYYAYKYEVFWDQSETDSLSFAVLHKSGSVLNGCFGAIYLS